jgi:hypothetical protein
MNNQWIKREPPMGLQQLFKNTPMSVFTPQMQKLLSGLRDNISRFVSIRTQDSEGRTEEFDSLLSLYTKAPWIIKIFPTMQGQNLSDVNLSSCRDIFALPAFQACWLLDGGHPDAFSTAFTWRNFAQQACEISVHALLLKMQMNDPDTALRATGALIRQCFEKHISSNHELYPSTKVADSFQLTALTGFNRAPDLVDTAPRDRKTELTEQIGLMVFGRIEMDESVALLLKNLVYTPGLKLKSQGFQVHQIIHQLTPEIEAIFDFCTDWISPQTPLGKPYAAFHRQVLINLFSPFADDLAFLDAHPGELVGNISEVDADRSIEYFVRSIDGALFAPTFAGPLVALAGKATEREAGDLYQGFEALGVKLDANLMFGGLMDNVHLRRRVLRHHGWCQTVDSMLVSLSYSGTSDLEKMETALLYARDDQFEQFTRLAKVGFIATRLEKGARQIDSGVDRLWQSDECPRRFLDKDPALKSDVLAYMRRNALLDHALLEWCGFDSSLLATLGDEASISLQESFLAQDLGI